MPELPEVETIRAGLARRIIGKKVTNVRVELPKMIHGSARAFSKALTDASFSNINRHGKLLLLSVKGKDAVVLIHLKMTGQLIVRTKKDIIAGGHQWPPVAAEELPNKYTHIHIQFTDGSELFFNDLRQFGYMELVSMKEASTRVAAMGVDPISQTLTWEKFEELLAGRKTILKAFLLNQSYIAGIGNIYADEICFTARVKPTRRISTLTKKEKQEVFRAITHILKRAIAYGGTTFRDYLDTDGGKGNFTQKLRVYGRKGLVCKRCKKGIIRKTVVAQRGTHFCPVCQK